MRDERDEAEAIAAAQAGDRDAFCVLVERHQEVAFRAAYLIVRDAGAAEDIAQDAFVRAYGSLRRFRRGEPFRPWLLRIVTNLALNGVRARGRREGLLARLRPDRQHESAADEGLVISEDRDLVLRAINELGDDDRLILYLRYFLELPEREIAAVIGRPAGTVKSRLSRAGSRLRKVIEERYPSLTPVGSAEGMTDA